MRNETRVVPIVAESIPVVATEEVDHGVTFVVSRTCKGHVMPKWVDEDGKAKRIE